MVEQVLQYNREKIAFWSLLGILVISLVFYMYFINDTVHNIVFHQNLESEGSKLTLSLGNKEFEYIQKKNAITLATAYSIGFRDANVKSYISAKQADTVAFLAK